MKRPGHRFGDALERPGIDAFSEQPADAANGAPGTIVKLDPLLIAQGLEDELVVPSDTTEFVTHAASLGIRVTYQEMPFATHGTVAYFAIPGLMTWLDRVVP